MIALWRPFETEIVPEEGVLESLTPVAVLERRPTPEFCCKRVITIAA